MPFYAMVLTAIATLVASGAVRSTRDHSLRHTSFFLSSVALSLEGVSQLYHPVLQSGYACSKVQGQSRTRIHAMHAFLTMLFYLPCYVTCYACYITCIPCYAKIQCPYAMLYYACCSYTMLCNKWYPHTVPCYAWYPYTMLCKIWYLYTMHTMHTMLCYT